MSAAFASHDIALPIPMRLPGSRADLAAYIESLIDLLDATEPDPDVEDQGDDEPWLGWTKTDAWGDPEGDDREWDDASGIADIDGLMEQVPGFFGVME